MCRRSGAGRGARVALIALLGTATVSAALQQGDTVRYGDDKLTVRLHGESLDDVLTEIATVSGSQLHGRAKDSKPVIAEFDAVPMSEALHRLLGDQNFTLTYGRDGKLTTIRLHGGPAAPAGPATAAAPAPPPPGPPPAVAGPGALIGLLDEHAPVPISGRLSEILGTTGASFRQLFDVAARNEEGPMRTEAVRVMLNALEAEPDLRTQVINGVKSVDDATMSTLVRAAAGERAEEFLMHVSALARGSEFRVKASTVLQQLRTQTPGG